jgi:hypothetical protein
VTPGDDRQLRPTGPDLRAGRLALAARRLGAELVEERRKVAELRRQVARLEARLAAELSADEAPRT